MKIFTKKLFIHTYSEKTKTKKEIEKKWEKREILIDTCKENKIFKNLQDYTPISLLYILQYTLWSKIIECFCVTACFLVNLKSKSSVAIKMSIYTYN